MKPKIIVLTGGSLLLLWGISFALSYVELGAASLPIALLIAALKAGIVGAVFMELAQARASIRWAMIAAGALAVVLAGLVVADVLGRAT